MKKLLKERCRDKLNLFFRENSRLMKMLFLSYIIGAIAGMCFAVLLPSDKSLELKSYLLGFLELFGRDGIEQTSFWIDDFLTYLKPLFIIWVLGASMVGAPLIFAFPAIRGFVTLFSIMFFVLAFGSKGMLFSIIGIAAIELFLIPVMVVYCTYAIKFSVNVFKLGRHNLLRFTSVTVFICMLAAGAAFLETLIFPKAFTFIT